jgi:hypothetical protein
MVAPERSEIRARNPETASEEVDAVSGAGDVGWREEERVAGAGIFGCGRGCGRVTS